MTDPDRKCDRAAAAAPRGPTPVTTTIDVTGRYDHLPTRISGDPVRQPATGQLVSARVRDLTATSTDAGARVVSMQDQARSGTVTP